MQIRWKMMSLTVAACAALALGGCGSDGKDGVPGKDGAPGKDAGATASVASMTQEEWNQLQISSTDSKVTGVTINSPPVVKFTVKTADGKPVIGLGTNYTKTGTNKLGTYNNVAFTIAKLVPGVNGSPSKWVSYIVTAVSNATGEVTDGARPTTENVGTLKDNGDGSYEYTFYRNVKLIKDQVAALTDGANNKKKEYLGDLTYDANLVHRVVVQIGGNFTGTNVTLDNPINLVYDFIPATGKAVTAADPQREITTIESCKSCHSKFVGLHVPNRGTDTAAKEAGLRQDPRFCVVCHTSQRQWDASASYIKDGAVLGDFLNLVHKAHMGERLTKTGYNYAGLEFNHITYPQPAENCAKCHTKSTAAPQGDNWNTNPSRLACGACHDAVDFATGAGHSAGNYAQSSDQACALCHDAGAVKTYHLTIDRSSATTDVASQLSLPAGATKIEYQIKDVKVATPAGDTKLRAQITFRILMNGTPVTFKTYTAGATQLLDNFTGGPTLYAAVALPREGIASPADFNSYISASLVNIWNNTQGVLGARDADGYYTATIGVPADTTTRYIPNDTVMVSGAIGMGAFAQTNVPGFTTKTFNIPAIAVWKEATGKNGAGVDLKARRTIVDAARCNNCHGQLGIAPSFHSGVRNGGDMCALCHTPDYSTGHTSATQLGGGWSVSAKDLMHGIHASSKRVVPFTYDSSYDFSHVTYPGVLKNCEQCHLPGTYDFRNTANADAVNSNSLLWNNAAHSTIGAGNIWKSQWVAAGNYGARPAYSYATNAWTYSTAAAGSGGNLIHSPISSACFGCHDTAAAVGHMRTQGGSIYEDPVNVTVAGRGTAFKKLEGCMACHGAGKAYDIKAVHSKSFKP